MKPATRECGRRYFGEPAPGSRKRPIGFCDGTMQIVESAGGSPIGFLCPVCFAAEPLMCEAPGCGHRPGHKSRFCAEHDPAEPEKEKRK